MDSPVVVEVGRPSKLLGSDLRIDEQKLNEQIELTKLSKVLTNHLSGTSWYQCGYQYLKLSRRFYSESRTRRATHVRVRGSK